MSQQNTTNGIPIPEGFTLVSQPESTPLPGGIPIPEGLTLMEELTPAQLKNLKAQGVKLTEAQERTLWDIEDAKPATEKVGEAVSAAIPAVGQALTDFGGGAVDLVYKGILRPVGASVIGMDDAEAAEIFDTAGKTLRSGAIGVARDVEETANAATRFAFFGSDLTDRAQGLDKEERFKRYMNREAMRQLEQAAREQNPDRANALLAENPLLQRLTATIATIQGGTPEEAEEAAKAYSEYLYETGLTKDEINEKVATVGEFLSPITIPGANRVTGFIAKPVRGAMTKTGDFALRNIALPIATGVEFGARKTVAGGEFLQNTAKGLGQYIVNDPDTFLKTGANTVVMPVMGPAKAIAGTSGVIKDILKQAADAGGTRGRRGIVERAGRSLASSDTTRALFGPDSKGGVFRAKTLDFMLRQGDAILQPGVNAAALNVVMGLPDIETGEQAGYAAGTGFGIGAIGGARVTERASALIDPRLSGAQRLTELLAVDPSQRRANEDADLRRFLATASPELQAQMADLSSIEKRKLAIKSRISSLETEKAKKISKADEEFVQSQIDGFQKQLAGLEKATPETQKEADRQVQLAFLDALDQAHSVGLSAGLSKLNIEVLDPANAEQYFRKKYGQTLTDAENTIALLTGIPSLSGADSQKLAEARELMARFNSQVNGAMTSRGFALNEDSTDPNSERYVPPHLRMLNQQGATAVINGDLLRHLGREGFNIRHVVQHEVQHALQNFNEVQQALRPIREYLFDQKVRNTDGTTETISEGVFTDNDIDRIAAAYASRMSPADNGASFIAGFGGDLGKLRAYMKDEILAEVAATGGEYANGTRASLDDVGQNLLDWLEVKTKNGALKSMKESLRKVGVVFDNNGEYSSVLETGFTPEVLATIRQYQRGIRDLNNTLTYTRNVEKDTPNIPLTKVLASKALQNKYRHADFFEKEPIIRATAPDGTVTEIPVPKNVNINPFVDVYRIANGQIVDADGKPISLAPEITFGSLPEGTTLQADTRIARKVDGTPIVLTNREMKARGIERTKIIRNAIDSAPDDGSPTRLVDTGNGNYRGTMSPSQIEAFMQLPNSLVPPRMKRMVAEVNEILNRRDGTRLLFEYQPALLNGKYKALSPRIRDEVPIGFQISKDGNFAVTTISVSRMYDKAEAWAAKRPTRLQAWNGDMGLFWDDVMKALGNHARGEKMEVGLDPDPYIALRKKNRINDLFNVYNAETKDANPERTTLPREKGKDSLDIVIRSRRIDRINEMSESSAQKMPFNYGLMTQNYLPADPITPEEFVVRTQSSVTPTRMRELIAAGKIDELQNILRASDDLLLQESLYVAPGGKIGVTSLFDPNVEPSLEDDELLVDLDAETNALRESLTSPEARAKYLSDQLETMYARGGTDPEIEAFESELEGIYQQLESQAQEQEAATEDFVEAPETTEVDTMNSPTDALLTAVDAYNSGRVDNEDQTLAQHIRSFVASEGSLRIPENVTDEQIEAAANDVVQYRESLKDRIRSGVAFSNAIVAPAGLQYLPAFHGSPYDFDKFRMDKIGSGEGAQAFGYGLYFSGARGVAEEYRKKLSFIKNSQLGSLYKVDLDVNDEDLLDWDGSNLKDTDDLESGKINSFISKYLLGWQDIKSIDDFEYNLKIAEQALAYGSETGFYNLAMDDARQNNLQDVVDYWAGVYVNSAATGEYIYSRLIEALGTPQKASEYLLNSLSIKGIRYLDGMSRGAGEGTSNYVIFDENLIKVLEKNDQPVGPITQFMPAVAVVPERFTGNAEDERRGRYVAPPEFWTRFDIDEFERGGKFFDLETGEDITDKTYATGTIDVTGKRPSLISDSIIEEMPEEKGRTWKTNLFRKTAGWEWISENPPEVAAIGSKQKPDPVLISVEGGKDHFYTLKTEFPNGVQLARYPNEGSEPRLRPTKKGQIKLGNVIGRIKTKAKEHPVYDTITIGTKFMPAESEMMPSKGKVVFEEGVKDSQGNGQYVDRIYGTMGNIEWDSNDDLFPRIRFAQTIKQGAGKTLYLEALNKVKSLGKKGLKSDPVGDEDEGIAGPTERAIGVQKSLERRGLITITKAKDGSRLLEITPKGEAFLQVSSPDIRFMPAEAPSGERGFQSKLQTEIQRNFKGARATPEQLKAVLGNPQNVKPEEVKWSGVMDEIDRLAQENNGKVPVQELLNYLRDEGQVKFDEVTLGEDRSIKDVADLYRIKIEEQFGEAAFYDEFDEPLEFDELPVALQDAIDKAEKKPEPKYAQYQLPGGENYREVVLSMPSKSRNAFKGDFEILNTPVNKFTSSHFPDIPNYIAHMRLNERTDAEGNEGLFVEEFQSDRHQQGREKGYKEEMAQPDTSKWRASKVESTQSNRWRVYSPDNPMGALFNANSAEEAISRAYEYYGLEGIPDAPFRKDWGVQLFKRALRDAVESGKSWIGWTTGKTQAERYKLSEKISEIATEPMISYPNGYRKIKLIPLSGNDFIFGVTDKGYVVSGWGNTGDEFAGKNLSEIIGKDLTNQIISGPEINNIKGANLDIGGKGMKGFYDQILPKEIGKYVAKMGGKVEKSGLDIEKVNVVGTDKNLKQVSEEEARKAFEEGKPVFTGIQSDFGVNYNRIGEAGGADFQFKINKGPYYLADEMFGKTPIWRVNITPEMENVVLAGQMQFMPAEGNYPSIGININDKTQDFTDQILRGEKTIETRDTNSLRPYIGKRVGIVRTGKGKATLVGYANLEEPIIYNNAEEFRADQDKHLVEAGSDFDIKPDQKKYGYPLTNVESIEPIQIPSDLPNWRVARSIPQMQFMPAEQQTGTNIPVAKTETDAEEDVADTELLSTGIDVPESVDEQSVISNAIKVANSQSWRKGRDFKMDMQRRVREAAEKAGVTISKRTAESIEYLARVGLKDALIALEQNPNAIGWYDEKTKQALGVMSLLFPEIATDENARFAFTWALAVTSNGLKVDKNFELAERVYRHYRKTGKMPNNIQAGQAQKAINKSLDLFNQLTKEWGIDNTRKFMQTDFTVGEISRLGVVSKTDKKEVKPGGEFSDTIVRGSAILGPKIGNGFFSNLYGLFDALTMDRWLVRTWGRWTGTLVELNPELTQISKTRLEETLAALTPEDKARMDEMIGQDISQMSTEDLSLAIQKASMKPELREVMNATPTGEEFRKAGNSLAKYLDGQKEAPANPAERNFIREIFGLMLDELKTDPQYAGLTMADLQAVLWYAEKRLYETAKVKADQDSLDSSDADGYEDDEAPDYANAAIGVARKKGVSQKRIDEILEKIKNDRTTTTRLADEGRGDIETEQQEGAGGFTGKEKQKFRQYVAVTTARRNRTGNEKALWTYSRKSGGDGGELRVLKPKSKKNLGVKYISEWKPGRKLATMYRNNGLPPVKFLELDSTDTPSAQKFADALTQSKEESKYGAAVYVYDTKDYQNMKLFMSESGKSGFAVKPDGDIVSVFSMEKGSGRSVIEAAIAAGGKKLDAFDTILPEFYGAHGFVEAARTPWNEEQAQYMEDWDKETFKEFNNGEPDVVMMVLDPKFEGEYEPRTDIYATDYDQAVEMQDSLLKKLNKGAKEK